MFYFILKNLYFFILPAFFLFVGIRHVFFRKNPVSLFLGIYLLAFFVRNISAYFLSEPSISIAPHFLKLQSFIHYLIGPTSYLFALFALKPYKKLNYWYLLHFLPFALHLIEYIPYLFSSVETKRQEMEIILRSGSIMNYKGTVGLLSPIVHSIAKFISLVIYLVLSIHLVVKSFISSRKSSLYFNNKVIFNWLLLDVFIRFLSLILIVLQALKIFNRFHGFGFSPLDALMFTDGLFNFLFLVFAPKIQSGLLFKNFQDDLLNQLGQNLTIEEQLKTRPKDALMERINIYMETEVPFIEDSFSIKTMSQSLNVTERQVSIIIKKTYDSNFANFVAKWRLNYIKNMHSSSPEWANFTIEQMAERAGFGSRQTLHKVINRMYNQTPSDFFKEFLK